MFQMYLISNCQQSRINAEILNCVGLEWPTLCKCTEVQLESYILMINKKSILLKFYQFDLLLKSSYLLRIPS